MSDYTDDDDGSDIYNYDSDENGGIDEDNDSDFDDVLDPTLDTKGKQKSVDVESRSLTLQALQDMITVDVRRAADVTGLQPPIASILLQYYRWDEDRLLGDFMDDSDDVLRKCGEVGTRPSIDEDESSPPPSKRARLAAKNESFDCPICCETVSVRDETFRARCGDRFCTNCWREFIVTNVKNEGKCLFKCMQDECPTYMDERSIERLAPDVVERYKTLVQQSYVQSNTKLRFCPHPSCTQTVLCASGRSERLLSEQVPTVHCENSHAFCFGCGHDTDHKPLLCKFVAIWTKSAREDAGTTQWLKANTKSCPKCQNSIEKNGGCNRILCRHCQFQFCWMCKKNWDVHGYSNTTCNAFVEPPRDAASDEAQHNLERWLFYFDRFNNHELSIKLEQELCERTEERMLEVQETSQLSWIEAKFMTQAVIVLTQCRRTLKWSYAMAYFLAKGNQKQIFEDLQADLEKAVEELSQLLEEEIEAETVKSLRQRTIDKTVYVQARHKILLDDTADGLRDERWAWTV